MRKILTCAMFAVLPLAAAIVDRIAISAGTRVITESEIESRLRLTAFESGVKPVISLAGRRDAAEKLLDQKLVEREMDVGHYPKLSDEARQQLVKDYAEQYYQSDPAALGRALAGYGLNVHELEDDLARQSHLLTFLGLRFRPAVQVAEQDVQDYFRTKTDGQVPMDQMHGQIEQALANQKADLDLEAWIKDQRKRTRIEYLDKDLAP